MKYWVIFLIGILGCQDNSKPSTSPATLLKTVVYDSVKYKAINEPIWAEGQDTTKEAYRFWIRYGMGVETRYVFRIEKINQDSFKLNFKHFTCDNNCNPFIQKNSEDKYHIIESKEVILPKYRAFTSAVMQFEFWQLDDKYVGMNTDEMIICDGSFVQIEGIRKGINGNKRQGEGRYKTYQSLQRSCVSSQNPIYEFIIYALNLIGQKNIKYFEDPSVFLQKQEEIRRKMEEND